MIRRDFEEEGLKIGRKHQPGSPSYWSLGSSYLGPLCSRIVPCSLPPSHSQLLLFWDPAATQVRSPGVHAGLPLAGPPTLLHPHPIYRKDAAYAHTPVTVMDPAP